MTTELFYLALTAVLAASLWIPFIVGVNMHADDKASNFVRPPDLTLLPDWVQRANRAHLNLIETALPFAALVLTAHVAGISTMVTVGAAIAFFWLRVAHAVGMITATARMPLRPIIFTASWLCSVAIFVELVRMS
ncbi:MAG: MAPEG family protein [Pseudomonadota bacterium]